MSSIGSMVALRHNSSILNRFSRVLQSHQVLSGWLRSIRNNAAQRNCAPLPPEQEEHELPQKSKNLPQTPKKPPCLTFTPASSEISPSLEKNSTLEAPAEIQLDCWKDLDEIAKKNISDEYHRKLEEYLQQLREHFTSLKQLKKQKVKTPRPKDQPNKPATAFAMFYSDEIKMNEPTGGNRFSEIGKKWRSLNPEEKEKYLEKHRLAQEEYRKKIAEWEREMILQGKEDLIKTKSKYSKTHKSNVKVKSETPVFRSVTDVTES